MTKRKKKFMLKFKICRIQLSKLSEQIILNAAQARDAAFFKTICTIRCRSWMFQKSAEEKMLKIAPDKNSKTVFRFPDIKRI